jgi:cytochrome b561
MALAMGVPPEDIRPVRVSGANRFWWIAPLPPIEPLARMGASPDGLDRQWKIHEASHGSHRFGAYLLIALLVLHVGGALKHQFLDRQPILARLRPRLVRRRRDG